MTTDLITAITQAEAEALAQHEAGTCHQSEWTCSHCEREEAPARP